MWKNRNVTVTFSCHSQTQTPGPSPYRRQIKGMAQSLSERGQKKLCKRLIERHGAAQTSVRVEIHDAIICSGPFLAEWASFNRYMLC